MVRFVVAVAFAVAVASSAAYAETRDTVIRELSRSGYTTIRIQRTWLGRTRFVGTGPSGTREIILNPSTGEVLRDHVEGAGLGGTRSLGDGLDGDTDLDGGYADTDADGEPPEAAPDRDEGSRPSSARGSSQEPEGTSSSVGSDGGSGDSTTTGGQSDEPEGGSSSTGDPGGDSPESPSGSIAPREADSDHGRSGSAPGRSGLEPPGAAGNRIDTPGLGLGRSADGNPERGLGRSRGIGRALDGDD